MIFVARFVCGLRIRVCMRCEYDQLVSMIHLSKIVTLMEMRGRDRLPVTFSMKFVKSSGELVTVNEAVCTSSYHGTDGIASVNIMFLPSKEVRKVRVISIIEFNGHEVYI